MKEIRLISMNKIEEKIAEAKAKGKREVWFFGAHLTKLDADQLEATGKKVEASALKTKTIYRPCFKISW